MPRPASLTFAAARRLGRLAAFGREHPAAADRALFDRLLRAMAAAEPEPPPPQRPPRRRRAKAGGASRRAGKD